VALDLRDGGIVDQRALVDTGFEAVADLDAAGLGGQLLHEAVVDAGLHVEAVGADAGLAGIAVFADHRAFDRGVDVGIVEDDEGGVAAEFQADPLHRRRALPRQDAARPRSNR